MLDTHPVYPYALFMDTTQTTPTATAYTPVAYTPVCMMEVPTLSPCTASEVIVNGRTYSYATPAEAAEQFRTWVVQAITFGEGKTPAYLRTIQHRGHLVVVQGGPDAAGVVVYGKSLAGRGYWPYDKIAAVRDFGADV